jgi:polysaccharide export outer membrane protein
MNRQTATHRWHCRRTTDKAFHALVIVVTMHAISGAVALGQVAQNRNETSSVRPTAHHGPPEVVQPAPDYPPVMRSGHAAHATSPCGPAPINGVYCDDCRYCGEAKWKAMGPIPFDVMAQGEYIGPARLSDVPEYRLRVDDVLNFVFRLTQDPTSTPYRLEVGDSLQIESLTAEELTRTVEIQPDGTISLRQIGQMPAANRTVDELREAIENAYKKIVRDPVISVSPLKTNSRLQELRATVDRRFGQGGQSSGTRVTPEGTVQLPGVGSVPAQGLTIDELKREVNSRYALLVNGLDITPILEQRAPRFVYVLGEVAAPGRFELTGPTTVMQALALAGSWNVGANLNQVVVFRRDENWCLMATKLDIRGALYGKRPCPADEIWIRDSDIVVVPKSPILVADEFIELVFTRGIYGVFPLTLQANFAKLSTL